jgi:RNA recognition motif-containing protein
MSLILLNITFSRKSSIYRRSRWETGEEKKMKSAKLYVGNLSYDVGEEKLREIFSEHGNVLSIQIIGGKGFGFVEMESPEAAQAAKDALDGAELEGRQLRVDEARPKKTFRGGGGGGRGRDRDKGGFRKRKPRW